MDTWTYVVLVGAAVLVLALFAPKPKAVQTAASQTTNNMEIALEQFMENTEQDHQELVKLVTQFREQTQSQSDLKENRIVQLESRIQTLEQALQETRQGMQQQWADAQLAASLAVLPVQSGETAPPQINAEMIEPAASDAQAASIHSRYAELLELYSQGKSIEAIAKKLAMNKGEVQLILQLAKQEESVRA
ncbi:hypothetical protein [Paenibacillus sp. NEAU-GSW1]|uniref:DUF6115 domain-containing protein n=1 Tax=Paenibacillus sp. NEAU-GSW1 TaxID=2682486 RepID=UPI0012E23880|nr:hypothetical protein [Paenibacillus sp. NEAU-GSW1]MUT66382.1 hypothetical protein [Paenibacillus sp. NEAU-GSW1]